MITIIGVMIETKIENHTNNKYKENNKEENTKISELETRLSLLEIKLNNLKEEEK